MIYMEVLVKTATLKVSHCIFEELIKRSCTFFWHCTCNNLKYTRQYECCLKQKTYPVKSGRPQLNADFAASP